MANDQLLRELDQGLADLKKTYEGADEDQLSQVALDQWSVKDVLAHITGWHYETSRMFDRMLRGERPTPEGVDYSNPDTWNAQFVEQRKGRSMTEVEMDLDTSYYELRSRAEMMPEDRMEPGKTGHRLLMDTNLNHYRDHANQIQQWRQSAGL